MSAVAAVRLAACAVGTPASATTPAARRPACVNLRLAPVPRSTGTGALTAQVAGRPLRTAPARRSRQLRVATAASAEGASIPKDAVSIVLLSGGVGKRMGAAIPKQYLELRGKPIATWSLETFLGMDEVAEVVIVCDPSWKYIFEEALQKAGSSKPVKFALPGAERQDSMTNGFKEIRQEASLVAIHDSARPMVTAEECRLCFKDAMATGAAVLGVPVKPTIKEIGPDGYVVKTLQRAALWEVQTPQVIAPALLQEGIELVARNNLEVTDDVSMIEALGKPVKITKGQYTNIKVTTPDDMSVAERFLDERKEKVPA